MRSPTLVPTNKLLSQNQVLLVLFQNLMSDISLLVSLIRTQSSAHPESTVCFAAPQPR